LSNGMRRNVKCPTCGRGTPDASYCEFCGRPLYSCRACKATISKDAMFCPECGATVTHDGRELTPREHVSWAWWLLPLFPFAPVIGGIIAWAYNRNRDPSKAAGMLWLGITLFVILIVGTVIWQSMHT
jgi:hypothetical protein